MSGSVLLLKAADDKYKTALEQSPESRSCRRALEAHFTDVLTFEYLNAELLLDVLTHLERYSGILVTSPRSAIAVANVVNGLDTKLKQEILEKLRGKPVFSVGVATSRELLPLGVVCKGDDAGSADMLSEYLHQGGVLPADCKEKPMVFLCGDKRRDTLPDSFRSRGLPLEELMVYQTCAVQNVDFPEACKVPDWIVFFSPSGLKVVKELPLPWESIRKAAIGKTTAAALHSHAVATGQAFWEADVTAPKPTPTSLALAIFDFEEGSKP
ncbi:Uroporphyrinogen-III synthase [Phytophthora palmivora]|uniref:Uroporphyrinogen-III synthase n=1 Tax=Phytophthora palmivora TaxID=4796 RepID=A0A2P4YDX4_9STRA|nr:Uroporphyrinogen-III synthase [Phytophthora palmivora]